MPKVSKEYREKQRMQILMAAFRCFGRKGFHETTMREICDEADMSPGSVYNYFDGKKAIINAIAEKSRDSVEKLFSYVDPSNTGLQNMQKILQKLSEFIMHPETSEGHIIRIRLWGEALKDPELKELFKFNYTDLIARFSNLIDEAKNEGSITDTVDSTDITRMIIACYQGMIVQKAFNIGCNPGSTFEAVVSVLKQDKT